MTKIYKVNFMHGNVDNFLIGEITEFDDYYEVKGKNNKIHKIYKRAVSSIMEVG